MRIMPKWKNAVDKKPEVGVEVLAYTVGFGEFIAWYVGSRGWDHDLAVSNLEPDYWMELPPKPDMN